MIRRPPSSTLFPYTPLFRSEVGVAEAEAAKDRLGGGLEPVAAERLEPMLEVTVARRQRVALRSVRGAAQRRGHLLHLVLDPPDLVEAGERCGEDRAAGAAGDLLGQIADRRLARAADAPGVGLLEPGKEPAERRLAHPVRADEPDPRAVGNPPRQLTEEPLPRVRLCDVLDLDHASARPAPWVRATPRSGPSRAGSLRARGLRRAGGTGTCPCRGTSWP